MCSRNLIHCYLNLLLSSINICCYFFNIYVFSVRVFGLSTMLHHPPLTTLGQTPSRGGNDTPKEVSKVLVKSMGWMQSTSKEQILKLSRAPRFTKLDSKMSMHMGNRKQFGTLLKL
ncbi:hypothetical protein V8G54_012331 [Vigna mungo]|uniref:Uncharacterized protein n=1 Tax=Vigna mungo TaxID=3915 RepID=A0AAQ3NS30_VIGMU